MIKNAGPLRLGAGRLLAFLGAGEAKRKGPAAGVMVCRWLPAWRLLAVFRGWLWAGNDPAEIRRYLISH